MTFFALPILSVAFQSPYIDHEQTLGELETKSRLGTMIEMRADSVVTASLLKGRGITGASLQRLFHDPQLSLKASLALA